MSTTAGPTASDEPDDPYTLVETLVGAGRWEAALPAISGELAHRPGDQRLLALLLRTLRGLGRSQEAVNAAQQLLTVTPNDPYALRLATLALLDVGWVDEAIGLAGRAVNLDPANAANHLALARAWAASPRRDSVNQQLRAAREAVLLAPNSCDAQVQIGVALAATGDAAAAREAYLSALRIDPQHAAALNNLAVLDLRAGATSQATKSLAAALAADPQGVAARRNLDAAAIRVLRRMSWWALLAPVPALFAGALGWAWVALGLALAALLIPPLVGLRSWQRLAAGQRTYLRTLPRRARRMTLAWPLMGMAVGAMGLALAVLAAPLLGSAAAWRALAGYCLILGVAVVLRATVLAAHAGPQRFAADLRIRWNRLTGR